MRGWLKKIRHVLWRIAQGAAALALSAVMWAGASPTAQASPGASEPTGALDQPTKRLVLELGRPMNADTPTLLAHWSHGSHGAHWSHGAHGSHWAHGSHGSHHSGIFIPFPG
jgi:hypothetical protein